VFRSQLKRPTVDDKNQWSSSYAGQLGSAEMLSQHPFFEDGFKITFWSCWRHVGVIFLVYCLSNNRLFH
jgi:hypothetical protein